MTERTCRHGTAVGLCPERECAHHVTDAQLVSLQEQVARLTTERDEWHRAALAAGDAVKAAERERDGFRVACASQDDRISALAAERDEALAPLGSQAANFARVVTERYALKAAAEEMAMALAGLGDRHFPMCAARYAAEAACDCEMQTARAALSRWQALKEGK